MLGATCNLSLLDFFPRDYYYFRLLPMIVNPCCRITCHQYLRCLKCAQKPFKSLEGPVDHKAVQNKQIISHFKITISPPQAGYFFPTRRSTVGPWKPTFMEVTADQRNVTGCFSFLHLSMAARKFQDFQLHRHRSFFCLSQTQHLYPIIAKQSHHSFVA